MIGEDSGIEVEYLNKWPVIIGNIEISNKTFFNFISKNQVAAEVRIKFGYRHIQDDPHIWLAFEFS